MTLMKPTLRSRWIPAVAFIGLLALPGSARAEIVVTYVLTDAEGTPLPEQPLAPRDMSSYSNQASCQCGHTWGARVLLDESTGADIPADAQVRTYVGAQCDVGQAGNVPQASPCVEIHAGLASDYAGDGLLLSFEQVWLSSRVESPDMQAIDAAEPASPCDPLEHGSGGIWVCVESNGQPGCQGDEFVVQGESTNDAGFGINYDHVPPQSPAPTDVVVEPGEGSVLVSWQRADFPDVSGFRVLCADMDGNPPLTKVTESPTGPERTNGKLYYTAENLCPGEVVHAPEVAPMVPDDVAGSPLASLDWRYVCSGHVAPTGTAVHVNGLEGGTEYQFVVVAYDVVGNPRVMSELLVAAPIGDGDGGCSCRTDQPAPLGAWLGTGLVLLGLLGRPRRVRR